jgi:hypothetical protein
MQADELRQAHEAAVKAKFYRELATHVAHNPEAEAMPQVSRC